MAKNRKNVFEENRELKELLRYKTKQANDWQKKYNELEKEFEKLKALLRQFMNENTPSSKLPFNTSKEEDVKKESKPKGKPKGSNGGTKKDPDNVDKKLKSNLEKRCPRCGKTISRKHIDTRIRYIYDARVVPEVIEVEEEFYPCDCGELCIGKHPEIPQRGMVGYNLQSLFTEMKFNFSGSYENISKFFNSVTCGKISFSPMAINDCVKGVAEKLEPSYDEMEKKLKEEPYSYTDETPWPVNGVLWFLWLMVTENFVFITIQNSRSRRVLIDIFGEDYHGGMISDCFRVYDKFAKWYQKCWSHLLRKAKFEARKNPQKNVVKLYEQLRALHKEIERFLKDDPSLEVRRRKKKEFDRKLNKIINYKHWCEEAQSIIDNRLKAYRNHWLTAVEIEGICLDNNICEREIRGSIGWRKMLGGHKTREGTKQFSIIQTHRKTWEHNGKYPYNELLNFIKN